jgi:predicted permease
MIINSLIGQEYSAENLKTGLLVLCLGLGMHVVLAVLSFVGALPIKGLDERKVGEFSMVFTNCGFIGFPILNAVFPGKGAFYGAFFVIGFHVYLWTLGIAILSRGRDDIKLTPKKAILNFGTVPCAIGFVLYLLKAVLPIPAFAVEFCNLLGNLSLPIAMLITGALLATISLPKMLCSAKLYLHSFIKLIVFPLAAALLARLCGLGETYILLITAMVGLPSAASVTMFAEVHNVEPGYASQTVGLTSVLSTATLPFVMLFAQWIASV